MKNFEYLIELISLYDIKNIGYSYDLTEKKYIKFLESKTDFSLFTTYDARTLGYVATGLAAEANKAVAVVVKDGASYRSMMPSLTEAYYRGLKILLIVLSNYNLEKDNNNETGITDIVSNFKDTVISSLYVPSLTSFDPSFYRIKYCEIINKMNIESGPVQITLNINEKKNEFEVLYDAHFSEKIIESNSISCALNANINSYAILLGDDVNLSEEESLRIDKISLNYNIFVFCRPINNYHGSNKINLDEVENASSIELLILFGAQFESQTFDKFSFEDAWQISEKGKYVSCPQLSKVLRISRLEFLEEFAFWENTYEPVIKMARVKKSIDFPHEVIRTLNKNCIIYAGKCLKLFNQSDVPAEVRSNIGCTGDDGLISMTLGASLANMKKRYVCLLTESEFLNDMNALGNRHVGNNITIILVSNKKFQFYKDYSENLGFDYHSFNINQIPNISMKSYIESNKSNLIEIQM